MSSDKDGSKESHHNKGGKKNESGAGGSGRGTRSNTGKKKVVVDAEGNVKTGKQLRFALPEETGGDAEADRRSILEVEIQAIPGVRLSPLRLQQTGRVSDVMKAMQADVNEEESGTSVYLETDSQVALPQTFAYKPLFNALRRSPTRSQVDYNLLMSANLRNLEGVKQAVSQGANVNVVQDRQTSLIIATENNDKPVVQFLITVPDIDLNYQNFYGHTALLIALRNGYDEIAEWLILGGADVTTSDNLGRTPLHEALFHGNLPLVKLLTSSVPQLEKTDCFGEKPIYTCTVKKPNIHLLEHMLRAGASCEYSNVSGLSFLSRAILNSTNFEVIKILVESGADVNHEDLFCKRTPLHMAAILNDVRIAQLLTEYDADPEIKTISGLTPFDLAVYCRCIEVAEYLAVITQNCALRLDNYKDTLLSRIPNYDNALYLLRTQFGSDVYFPPGGDR